MINNRGELKKAITKALVEFRPIYNAIVEKKIEKESYQILIPESEVSYTEEYELFETNKNVFEQFYIQKKNYNGKENETKFIKYIDESNIEWWHKQNNSGRNVFAIEYYNTQEKKYALFNPDFIIKKGGNLYILDTKEGITAKEQATKDKSEALQKWIKENQNKYNFNIIGGIIKPAYPSWKINSKDIYIYENDDDWEDFEL